MPSPTRDARIAGRATRVTSQVLLRGVSIADAAEAEGVSTSTVSSDLRRPFVQDILESLYRGHEADLRSAFAKTLQQIHAGLEANRIIERKGASIDTGYPDWFVRIASGRLLKDIFDLGLKGKREGEERKLTFTWEEFSTAVEQVRALPEGEIEDPEQLDEGPE